MKNKILILSTVVSLYLMGCNNGQTSAVNAGLSNTDTLSANFKSPKADLTAEEAFTLSKQGALIIDVREPDELAEQAYGVKNIKNIPLGELEVRLSEVPKDKQVIVVCKRGGRSFQAFELLRNRGYENVANMEGGIDAWQEKGLPTIKGNGR